MSKTCFSSTNFNDVSAFNHVQLLALDSRYRLAESKDYEVKVAFLQLAICAKCRDGGDDATGGIIVADVRSCCSDNNGCGDVRATCDGGGVDAKNDGNSDEMGNKGRGDKI